MLSCMVGIALPLICHCSVVALSLLCRCYAIALPLLCCCSAVALLLLCRCSAVALPLLCRCSAVALLLLCCCSAVALPLLCRCLVTPLYWYSISKASHFNLRLQWLLHGSAWLSGSVTLFYSSAWRVRVRCPLWENHQRGRQSSCLRACLSTVISLWTDAHSYFTVHTLSFIRDVGFARLLYCHHIFLYLLDKVKVGNFYIWTTGSDDGFAGLHNEK